MRGDQVKVNLNLEFEIGNSKYNGVARILDKAGIVAILPNTKYISAIKEDLEILLTFSLEIQKELKVAGKIIKVNDYQLDKSLSKIVKILFINLSPETKETINAYIEKQYQETLKKESNDITQLKKNNEPFQNPSFYGGIYKKIIKGTDERSIELKNDEKIVKYFQTSLTPFEKKILLSECVDNYSIVLEFLITMKIKIELEYEKLSGENENSINDYIGSIEGLINENAKKLEAVATELIKKGDKLKLDEIALVKYSLKNRISKVYDLLKTKTEKDDNQYSNKLSIEFKSIYYYQDILLRYLDAKSQTPAPAVIMNYIKKIQKWWETAGKFENGTFKKKIVEIVSLLFKIDSDANNIVQLRLKGPVNEKYIYDEYLNSKNRVFIFQQYLLEKKKYFAISKKNDGKHFIEIMESELELALKNLEKIVSIKLFEYNKKEKLSQKAYSNKTAQLAKRKVRIPVAILRKYNKKLNFLMDYKNMFLIIMIFLTIISYAINFNLISFNEPYLSTKELNHLFEFSNIEYDNGVFYAELRDAEWSLLSYDKKQSKIEGLLGILKEKNISEFVIINENKEEKMKVLSNDVDLIATYADSEERIY